MPAVEPSDRAHSHVTGVQDALQPLVALVSDLVFARVEELLAARAEADSWVKVKQAAELTGFTRETIEAAIRGQKLRADQPMKGGHYRIRRADLAAWMAGGAR